jgi:hypothetical protein
MRTHARTHAYTCVCECSEGRVTVERERESIPRTGLGWCARACARTAERLPAAHTPPPPHPCVRGTVSTLTAQVWAVPRGILFDENRT